MASQEIIKTVQGYDSYIKQHGLSQEAVEAYCMAANAAFTSEDDLTYAKKVAAIAKYHVNNFILKQTGGTIWDLDEYCAFNDVKYSMLEQFYGILKLEAQNGQLDSYLIYLEKNRNPKKRFYLPKRAQFHKFGLIEAYQGLIDDKYDIICISMIPGSGKTTLLKFFNSAVIGWYPNDYNLFYSHSGDITRMYYDGVLDIVQNTTEYLWSDIFSGLSVTSTNAKMGQFNVGAYKPFPSLQTASVGSENAGKVRASKFLLIDDLIGKLEEALNKCYLDKLWSAYTVDARQRKTMDSNDNPCKEVIQATRWATQDPIGRIIQIYGDNPRVKIISMPDIDEQTGQSNFDYKYGGFTVAFFKDQALLMDDISYKCLYKQQPIEREGLLYQEDEVLRYDKLPDGVPEEITGQCDHKDKGIDFMFMFCAKKYGDKYYIDDCVCNRNPDYEIQYESLTDLIVNNQMQNAQFESNQGGGRVALEVNNRVTAKGWICNITDVPTETNKEARIYQCANWIKKHCVFKDKKLYAPKSDYATMMAQLFSYTVAGKNANDDIPDCFSLFALRKQTIARKKTIIMHSPI